MDLDTIRTRLTCPRGRLPQRRDDLLTLWYRHLLTLVPMERIWPVGGAQRGFILEPGNITLPAGVRQLDDVFTVIFMNPRDQLAPERYLVIPIYARIVGDNQP